MGMKDFAKIYLPPMGPPVETTPYADIIDSHGRVWYWCKGNGDRYTTNQNRKRNGLPFATIHKYGAPIFLCDTTNIDTTEPDEPQPETQPQLFN